MSGDRLSREEIIDRLRQISACKPGDPFPKFLSSSGYGNDWGPPLSDLCGQAADLILEEGAMADMARYGD